MKRLVPCVAIALLAACSPSKLAYGQVKSAMLEAGLSEPNAACMAERMTDRLTLGTDRSFMESGGAVLATAPIGQLEAGGLRMDVTGDGKTHLLVFNKGVRLIYQPNH